MKKYETDIPEEIYLKLLPFICITDSIRSSVDPTEFSLGHVLKRDYLRRWFGDRYTQFMPALKWAVEHPEKNYHVFVDDRHKARFTNEDCMKLMKLFLRSFEHINDEGPDIIQHGRPYFEVPGDLDELERKAAEREKALLNASIHGK